MDAIVIRLTARRTAAEVYPTLVPLQLVAEVAVRRGVNAFALGPESMPVGAPSEGAVPQSCNSNPIGDQQVVGLPVVSSASDLILHIRRGPLFLPSRPYPFRTEHSEALKVCDFIPLALASKVSPHRQAVFAEREDDPVERPDT